MTEKGIWLKQDKKCSDIFYHIKPHIQINHQWNVKDRYDVITTEYSWNNGDCSLVKTNGREIFTATCPGQHVTPSGLKSNQYGAILPTELYTCTTQTGSFTTFYNLMWQIRLMNTANQFIRIG